MKQYKINRTKKENLPSDETVEKHKDYSKLQVRYDDVTKRSKKPLYKNPKMFLFFLLVAVVAYVIYLETSEPEAPAEENPVENTQDADSTASSQDSVSR